MIKETTSPNTKNKAKTLSNSSKVLALLFVLGSFFLKGFGQLTGISIDDVLKVGCFIGFVWAPVDISLWIRNIRAAKNDQAPVPEALETQTTTEDVR